MHYLVTGGCGFIGSHLAHALHQQGHKVRIVDDLSTGKESNIHDDMELLIGNICDADMMEYALQGVDGCFHLAAIASVNRSLEEWHHTHQVNLSACVQLFELVKRTRIPIVYASSAAVYGLQPEGIPIAEIAPTVPLSSYGVDKLGCELHAHIAARIHNIPSVGLRFFNVYGPRQEANSPYSGVISIFVKQFAAGAPITLYGDGRQIRDFIYVSDVVNSLIISMQKLQREEIMQGIYNICSGHATDIISLAALMSCITKTDVDIHTQPDRKGNIRFSLGNPERAVKELGFSAQVHLNQGLQMLWQDLGNTA